MFGTINPEDIKTCPICGYRMIKPWPKICPNPKCLKPLEEIQSSKLFIENVQVKIAQQQAEQLIPKLVEKEPQERLEIKDMEISKETASSKIKGVKVKTKTASESIDLSTEIVVFPLSGQYFKNIGIVTDTRVTLYNRNQDYIYIHELSSNLDYIASSIMEGEIEKLTLRSEASNALEKVTYTKEKGFLYYVYGMFPDKQGSWVLKEVIKAFKDVLITLPTREFEKLDKMQLHSIKTKMDASLKYILGEYVKMATVLTDNLIPPVDEKLRMDYFGMSYKSIGIISKLLGTELNIELNMPNLPKAQMDDMKESLITAKIEAIAANTIGNTQAIPVYLSVKLGYGKIRYLLFEKLKNDYFIYALAEGNINKYSQVIEIVKKMVEPITARPFKGDLTPFIVLKQQVTEFFKIRFF
jgi:hypothetical protein